MALVPVSSSGPGTSGGSLSPSSSEGQGGSGGSVLPPTGALSTDDVAAVANLMSPLQAGAASAVWPTANLAIALPFSLPAAKTVRGVGWTNGAAVSGNVDAGIYNEDGTRVVTCGSQVQAGTSVIQTAALASTPLAAGSYFLVLCIDNTTGTTFRSNPITQVLIGAGVQQAAAAIPLAASITFANPANAYLPQVFVSFVSVF